MDRIKTIFHDVMNGGWQLQLAGVMFLLTSVLLLFTVAYQVVDMTRIDKLADQSSAALSSGASEMDQNALASIINTPIFGSFVEEKVEKVNTTLQLLGIMTAADSKVRRAFIAEPNQVALVYKEGDEISKGLKVYRIESDKVTLLRFGKPETLYIAWDEVSGGVKKTKKYSSPGAKRIKPALSKPKFDREEYLEKIRERFKERGGGYPGFSGDRGFLNRGF